MINLDFKFLREKVHGFADMEAAAKRVRADTERYKTRPGYVPAKETPPEETRP